jgi:hypothetical protein
MLKREEGQMVKATKEAIQERFHPLVATLPEEMKEALGTLGRSRSLSKRKSVSYRSI